MPICFINAQPHFSYLNRFYSAKSRLTEYYQKSGVRKSEARSHKSAIAWILTSGFNNGLQSH